MSFFKKLSRFALFGLLIAIWSFRASAQYCETPASQNALADVDVSDFRMGGGGALTVKIFAHVIRQSDGTDGASWNRVMNEIDTLNADFSDAGICFVLVGTGEIHSSFFADAVMDAAEALTLKNNFGSDDVLDMFILPDSAGHSGNAWGIPNNYFTMGAQRIGKRTMSHEMGHCLGLYHTHEIAMGVEKVTRDTGSACYNCNTAGDLICDTDADINVSGFVDAACNYTLAPVDVCVGDGIILPYTPDVTNIMSYGDSCRSSLTLGQTLRIQASLLTGASIPGDPLEKVIAPDVSLNLFNTTVNFGKKLEVASSDITAGNIMGLGNYNTIGSAYTTFSAGDYVELAAGFYAKPNSGLFLASTYDCHVGTARLGGKEEISTQSANASTNISDNFETSELSVYPNPFSGKTTIEFNLTQPTIIKVEVLDMSGKRVRAPVNEQPYSPGNHHVIFDRYGLAPGMYLCKLSMGANYLVKKMIVTD